MKRVSFFLMLFVFLIFSKGYAQEERPIKVEIFEVCEGLDISCKIRVKYGNKRILVQPTPAIATHDFSSMTEEGNSATLFFTEEGKKKFHKFTEASIGKRAAIFINDKFLASPEIKESIDTEKLVISFVLAADSSETESR